MTTQTYLKGLFSAAREAKPTLRETTLFMNVSFTFFGPYFKTNNMKKEEKLITKNVKRFKKMMVKDVLDRWLCTVIKKKNSKLIMSHIEIFDRLTEMFEWYKTRKVFAALCVRGDKRIIKLFRLSELVYIRADGSYTIFHFIDGKTDIITQNMSKVEKMYIDPWFTDFARVHRSYIVNLSYFSIVGPNYIESTDGLVVLPVGKDYRENIFKKVIYVGKHKEGEKGIDSNEKKE